MFAPASSSAKSDLIPNSEKNAFLKCIKNEPIAPFFRQYDSILSNTNVEVNLHSAKASSGSQFRLRRHPNHKNLHRLKLPTGGETHVVGHVLSMVLGLLSTMQMDHFHLLSFQQINHLKTKSAIRRGMEFQLLIQKLKRFLSTKLPLKATDKTVFMPALPNISVVPGERFLMTAHHTLPLNCMNCMKISPGLYLNGRVS